MKNYTLLLLLFIGSIWSSFAQCEENVTNVLCADPTNNVYIVSPTADVMIEILDSASLPIQGVTWQNPRTFLYITPAQANALTAPTNSFTTAVYFNGSPHSSPQTVNPWPQAGAQANTTYTYNYTMPASAGCTPANGQIRIVTGGFTYDDYCTGDTTTLNNIPLLNYNTAGNLNWYSDAAGTIPIAGTTQIQGDQTYYVDLGITGCTQVFPVVIEYATPPPSLDPLQRFCTGATWQAAGFPNPGDTLGDVDISGSGITWYSDAAGTMPVANPNSVLLNSGDIYYVSQEIAGCESAIQQINFVENECACIDENLAFHSENYGTISSCNFGIDYTTAANAYPASSVGLNDDPTTRFAHTNPGSNIAFLANEGVVMPQTSPLGGSSGGIRINDYSPSKTGGTLVKEFIAGEVMTFDFLILFEDPNHSFQDQPSLTMKLLDASGNMVQQRCIVSNPIDCIFNEVPNTGGNWLYSEWSCVKINTIELQGQAATIEITITDCDLGGHTGVAYIDRFYVGDDGPNICQDSAFGYMAIDPIDQAGASYEACSLFQEPVDPNCAPALPVINTSFPIEICGTFDAPIGNNAGGDAPITDIEVNIIGPNGNIVYSPPNFTQPSPGEFCITINQSDIPFPYGQFTVEGEIEYTMNCAVPPQPYEYYVQAQSNGFKFCPVADCPLGFVFC
ncbi:hypothetical protein, partial [Mesonia sp. K7]|uniref:hypothetical protein n=1 Tax=Mesonia sp. K7 TaxID=2218606 RepID=UPI0011B6154E